MTDILPSALTTVAIPNRPVFRSQDVCEIAQLQPYVLRTWEAEFPDLGVVKSAGGPRVYRRVDVERVLRIKHLLFVEGLTLAGARRRLGEESPAAAEAPGMDADVAALIDSDMRRHMKAVREGLGWILGVLSGEEAQPSDFVLLPAGSGSGHGSKTEKIAAPASRARTAKPAKKGRRK